MFRNGYRDRWRDGYRERATNQKKKMGRKRERAYVKGLVERNNKKIEKIDYLNRIDKLMWVFCKTGCVK